MERKKELNTTHESQAEVITTEMKQLSVTVAWRLEHDDEIIEQEPIRYSFNTQEELNAFILGAEESIGFVDYEVMFGDPFTIDSAQWTHRQAFNY